MHHPGEKTCIYVFAEDISIDLNLCFEIKNIGYLYIFNTVRKGLELTDILLVFRIHQRKKK